MSKTAVLTAYSAVKRKKEKQMGKDEITDVVKKIVRKKYGLEFSTDQIQEISFEATLYYYEQFNKKKDGTINLEICVKEGVKRYHIANKDICYNFEEVREKIKLLIEYINSTSLKLVDPESFTMHKFIKEFKDKKSMDQIVEKLLTMMQYSANEANGKERKQLINRLEEIKDLLSYSDRKVKISIDEIEICINRKPNMLSGQSLDQKADNSQTDDDESPTNADIIGDKNNSPEQKALKNQLHEELNNIINELDDMDKNIIELYYFQNNKQRKIARELEIDQSAVSKRLTNLKENLAKNENLKEILKEITK